MRRLIMCVMLACVMLAGTTAAAFVPTNVVSENRDGRQLIVKTFTLSAGESSDSLIEEAFTQEGYSYSFISIVKEEKPFKNKKSHSETVKVETQSRDLSVILNALAPTFEYDDGEYSGSLTLDHTTLNTEVTGYSTKNYTVSETKTIEGLDRNDPSYVPKTTVKDGHTLTLQNVDWAVQGTSIVDEAIIPTLFMATATYSGSASQKVANGYVTTAAYSGEIVSSGIEAVVYTVTYVGEPIPKPAAWLDILRYIAYALLLLLLLACAVFAIKAMLFNTKIYALKEDGVEYELIGKQRIKTKEPVIDLRNVKKYPKDEATVEIGKLTARRLFGRIVRIYLRDGVVRTHLIEQNGSDNYWFTVATANIKEDTE